MVGLTAEAPDSILETLDEKRPSATTDPRRSELMKSAEASSRSWRPFFDPEGLKLAPLLGSVGLDGLKGSTTAGASRTMRSSSVTRIAAPSPRKGALALLDGPAFAKDGLPPIPESATDFTVVSFDAKATIDKLVGVAKTFQPDAEERWNKILDLVKARTKLRLKEDILGRLGPKAAWYIMPAKSGPPAPGRPPSLVGMMLAGYGLDPLPRAAIIIDVEDSAGFGKALDE